MAQRPSIAIPFNYDEGWIGGNYYIQHLVSALGSLPPGEQPDVWMLSQERKSFEFIEQGTHYPRLNWVRPGQLPGLDGGNFRHVRWWSRLTPRFLQRRMDFDVVFPFPVDTSWKQTVCWIPDFQEKYLPQFFEQAELDARTAQHRYYIDNFRHIVFSSEAAKRDFHTFYPDATTRTHVLRFAVFHDVTPAPAAEVRAKHRLPERYFYAPNQFWIHKNHAVIVDAVEQLAREGVDVTVAFSGKEHDRRAPEHARQLKERVAAAGLGEKIRFLGFLPREEQMALMGDAIAIVQPSLFEGWSTVIEDAKFVSQYVLASSLPVNIEQIDRNVEFFDPHDADSLARLFAKYATQDPPKARIDYRESQRRFAQDFMRIVQSVRDDRA